MAIMDFGTVRGFGGEEGIDLFFPLTQTGFKEAIKKQLKARWNPERRCWTVVPKYARTDIFGICERIRTLLYSSAPEEWPAAVDRFGGFACATRRYEVKVGAGGIRIRLPDGHAFDYVLKKKVEAAFFDRDARAWLIPAFACGNPRISKILTRIVSEDKDIFRRALEQYEDRSIRGTLITKDTTPGGMGIIEGAKVFASHAFLSIADPHVPNKPVQAWPFKVVSFEEQEDEEAEGPEVRLAYMDPDEGYLAVRKRQAQPEDERLPLLDLLNANAKWASKRG
jgi:hypothetical protein